MFEELNVSQLMSNTIRTVHPRDSLGPTMKRLAEEGVESAIVSDDGVPVGVLDTRSIDRSQLANSGRFVEDVMLRDVPSLTKDMGVDEVSVRSTAAGTDRMPVVDRNGFLIGEVSRGNLDAAIATRFDTVSHPQGKAKPRVIDANDPSSVLSEAEPGMSAITTDGTKVGVVTHVHTDQGDDAWIVVEHGMLNKKRTLVPGNLVDLVDGNVVFLSIGQQAFKSLPTRQS